MESNQKGRKNINTLYYRHRTGKIFIETLQNKKIINEIKKRGCCNVYDLSIKISLVTPVSNKVVKFSDFPLILIIYREIKCLLEIFTEFAGFKIKKHIKIRDGFCKRLDAKITFFPN